MTAAWLASHLDLLVHVHGLDAVQAAPQVLLAVEGRFAFGREPSLEVEERVLHHGNGGRGREDATPKTNHALCEHGEGCRVVQVEMAAMRDSSEPSDIIGAHQRAGTASIAWSAPFGRDCRAGGALLTL